MNWAMMVAGILAVALALFAQWYLKLRVRLLERGARRMAEYRILALELLDTDIPDESRAQIEVLAELIGRGLVTRHLMRALANGQLDTPVRRAVVEARRRAWIDIPKETRVKFTRTIFSGLLADSYYSGLFGVIFRRAMFFVSSDPQEIAESVDALETRILIVGTAEIVTSKQRIVAGRALARA